MIKPHYFQALFRSDNSLIMIIVFVAYRGRKVFEPPRYMTVAQAAEQILEAIDRRRKDENGKQLKSKQPFKNVVLLTLSFTLSLSLSLSLPLPSSPGLTAESRCVGVARVGTSSQCIVSDSLCSISQWDLGGPLHSMVIVGTVHPLEDKMLTLATNASKYYYT